MLYVHVFVLCSVVLCTLATVCITYWTPPTQQHEYFFYIIKKEKKRKMHARNMSKWLEIRMDWVRRDRVKKQLRREVMRGNKGDKAACVSPQLLVLLFVC